MHAERWSVSVFVGNDRILTISESSVSGEKPDADTIRHAAYQLLAFIGELNAGVVIGRRNDSKKKGGSDAH